MRAVNTSTWFQKTLFLLMCLVVESAYSSPSVGTKLKLTPNEVNWLSQHPSISVAFDGYYPPYSFINDHGAMEGISIDVFDIISEKLDIKLSVYPEHTWKKLFDAAKQRKVDVVATMVDQPKRRAWFRFTTPYILKSLIIVTDAKNTTVNRREDLNQQTVALVEGYHYVEQILQEHPDIKPYYVENMLEGLRAVSTGKADASIAFLGAAHYYRTKYLLSNLKYAAVYSKEKNSETIAVRSDWPELNSILNKALNSISEQQMQALRAKWLPEDYSDLLTTIDLTKEELTWISEHPEIRLGIDPEFAPFEYLENDHYQGITSEYINLLNQRLNLNMKIVKGLSWDEVIAKAKNKEIDVLPAVGKNKSRQKYLGYTEPYLEFHRVIITRIEAPFIMNLEDIANLRVGVQSNSSHHSFLLEHSDIKPTTYNTLEETLTAASGGSVDAVIGNVASATHWIRKLNLTNLKIAAPASNQVQGLHFAIRNDWPELTSILQKGLNSISSQARKKISDKWIYVKYEPTTNYALVWIITSSLSIIIFAILLWNILLTKKVKERSKEILRYAYYDPLTGLPNRFLIQDRLSHFISEAKKQNYMLAMLSLDLDEFKKINDTFGYQAGDEILIKLSRTFASVLGDEYVLGRIHSGQFLAIIPEIIDPSDAAMTAKKLLKTLDTTFDIEGHSLAITASLGIAIYPDDGQTAETLIKNADSATHHSKSIGHGSYAFYTDSLHKQAARKIKIESQMRSALQKNEFYVDYQPKIETFTQKIIGFEALLRWSNPHLGEIPPSEFIPIAEKNGLIEPIGLFALRISLDFLAELNKNLDSSLTMAVNLSPRQFKSENLLFQIESCLHDSNIDTKNLELEITEGVLLSGSPHVESLLKELREMGVRLSMDDFGTGYSSMSYLRRYTFNILKIDKEFIDDIASNKSDRQLVSATIAMAHNLNMSVIAEGVETEAQYHILKQCNCDIIQGWLFSKALSRQQTLDMMNHSLSPPAILSSRL